MKLLFATVLVLFLMSASCSAQKQLADINHIVHMGQSLGGGEQSLPVVTDSATGFGNIKFKTGTSTWTYNYYPDRPELRAADRFSFVPLTAQVRGAEGETIANGLCDHLKQFLQHSPDAAARFLFSYAGQGGRYLRELNKRNDDAKDPRAGDRQSKGGHYNTSIDDIRRAKHIADSLHLSYSVTAITWMQGERGNDAKINRWDSALNRDAFLNVYKNDLVTLKNDYQQDIRRITGQKKKPPFFTYQTAGTMSGTAQLMACDQEKDMYMVGPTYMLPTALNGRYYYGGKLFHGATVHLSADGERWLGELFGKVIRRVVIEKEHWQPLRPVTARYNKNEKSITVTFHVPNPPIVLDSVFLPAEGSGLGFEVYDSNNRFYPVSKVHVAGNDRIIITLTDTLAAAGDHFVRYGLRSYVAEVSVPIKNFRADISGNSVEVVFGGDVTDQFAVLDKEGVFYLGCRADHANKTNILSIRKVYKNSAGDTVLEGEPDNVVNDQSFKVGQKCFTSRIYAYGNVRDSDTEKAVFSFRDSSYGARAGQYYPLYNWCVVFQDLAVKK